MNESLLTCGHRVRWYSSHIAPRRGERVYCYACADMRQVVGSIGDWQATCRDCAFKRTYMSDFGLQRGVRRHLSRNVTHRVMVGQIGEDDTHTVSARTAPESEARTLF